MPQVRTTKRGGSRFYIHPTNRERIYPGVTSVVGMLPKPFLQPWASKLTATLAVDSLDFIQRMAEEDRDGAIKYLSGASFRYTKARASLGGEAHDIFERLMRGEHVGRVRADLTPYVVHFREFLEAVNPELLHAEDVVWSDRHEYAGSFDCIMTVWLDDEGKPTPDRSGTPYVVIVDWKTGKDIHADVAIQLSAYANADHALSADGTAYPLPEIQGGFALHVTAESWDFIPVRIGPNVFDHFLHLRSTFDWTRELSRDVILPAVASGADRIVTGTQRRG